MADSEVIETRTVRMWLTDEGIFYIVGLPGSVHGRAEAEENIDALTDEFRQMSRPVLADLRQVSSVNRGARNVYRNPTLNRSAAVALLVNSPLSRTIGNFFLGLNRLQAPARIFTSEEEALAWLRGFRHEP